MSVIRLERPVESASAPHHRELDLLRQAYEEARQTRRGRVVVLHGPRGAGADALVAEWRRELHRRRDHVFEGDCLPGAPVYAPLAELVSRWVRSVEDLGLDGESLHELCGQVGPALGIPRLVGGERQLDGQADTIGAILFYETLGRLFTELSVRLPGVVIVRDLQVADSATRAAFSYLIQNVVTDPVGAWTPDGMQTASFRGLMVVSVASESEVAGALQRTLGGREGVTFVSLQEATEEAVRRFLSSPEVVRRFTDSSGGVTDNLEALLEGIPQKVEDLFLRRCEQLTPEGVEVLGALAVLGKPVPPDFLLRVLGEHSASAASLLSVLHEKRVLVRRVLRGQLLVDLPTEQNRQIVYERLSPALRRDLHGRIGSLLEERARYGEPADLTELAHHYLLGEVPGKAAEYALQAAERLHISYAYERAIELLEASLPLLDGPASRREVLDRLIDLHACQSNQKRALFYCGQLKKTLAERERGPVYRRAGQMLLELGNYRGALRVLETARTLVEQAGLNVVEELDELVRIDAIAAEAYYGQGRYERVEQVCQQALKRIRSSPRPDHQRQVIRLTNTLGKVQLFREDYVRATHAFQENLQRAEEHSWMHEALQARFNLGTIALQRRRYDEAERTFSACLNLGYTGQNPIIRAFCLMNLGVGYHKTHRYEEALDAYLHGLATFKKSGNELQFAVVAMNLGSLYQTLGDRKRARALVDTSLEVTEARGIRFYQGWGKYVRGGIALDEGLFEEAERELAAARTIMEALGSASWVDRIRVRQARLAFEGGQWRRVDELVRGIRLDPSSRDALETEAEGLLWLGRARQQRGEAGGAAAALVRARELFERIEAKERLWFADLCLAELHLGQGRRVQARRRLEAAASLIRELEAKVPRALAEVYRSQPDRGLVVERLESVQHAPAPRPLSIPVRRALPILKDAGYRQWRSRYDRIVGEDPKLLQIFKMIERVADSDSTILIQGESGTGKELIAEAIHTHSARAAGPFVKVNCAAFVETLLLSELFGHEKGAFTGALNRKKGRFELAHGGTLFLDEIGDISPNTQVALLRVLQERTFERVGGGEPIEVDVRVIVATNRNLEEMVKREEFRLDLYYRLKGIIMELPPLRDRRPDVVRLLRHFLGRYLPAGREQQFSRDALDFLARYSWPGNIRELENFTRSMTLFVDEPVIDLAHVLQFEEFFADGELLEALPAGFFDELTGEAEPVVEALAAPAEHEPVPVPRLTLVSDDYEAPSASAAPREHAAVAPAAGAGGEVHPADAMLAWAMREGVGLPELRRRLEIECIKSALQETGGNITKAADLLDMKRPRLSQIINATPELAALKRELVSAER